MLARVNGRDKTVRVALVGQQVRLHDAYLSVIEALNHGGYECGAIVDIKWVDSDKLTDANVAETFAGCAGIIVPAGFGGHGVEGMVAAAKYAREHNVPYLGICLGMQVAAIEFARAVLNRKDANSAEFNNKSKNLVVDLMPSKDGGKSKEGFNRLGSYPCKVVPGSLLSKIYGEELLYERHRHRYEISNAFRAAFEKAGIVFSGSSPDGSVTEALELPSKSFFVGVEFQPEFRSRPNRAHPLFREFVKACCAAR